MNNSTENTVQNIDLPPIQSTSKILRQQLEFFAYLERPEAGSPGKQPSDFQHETWSCLNAANDSLRVGHASHAIDELGMREALAELEGLRDQLAQYLPLAEASGVRR